MKLVSAAIICIPLLVIMMVLFQIPTSLEWVRSSLSIENEGWIYAYQNLIAGLSALVAAILTALIIQKNHNDLIERERLQAKAYMHEAAVNLSQYCEKYLLCFLEDSLDYPGKIVSDIEVFKKSISSVEKENVQFLKDLVSSYQIFNSRVERCLTSSLTQQGKKDLVMGALVLRVFAMRALSYARASERKNCIHYVKTKQTDALIGLWTDANFRFLHVGNIKDILKEKYGDNCIPRNLWNDEIYDPKI